MYIIICTNKLFAASKEYQTLFERLGEACDGHVVMSRPFVMDIGLDIRVEFRRSDKDQIVGLRPDYYVPYDEFTSTYLSRTGAKELKDLDEVFNEVVKHYLANPPVSENNWR